MQCEELKDLVPLLLVDLLDEQEQAAVRRHLDAGCPSCACEMAASRQTLDLLPLALPPETPPPSAKSRLMASIRKEENPRHAVASAPPAAAGGPAGASWPWVAAAALAGALLGAVIGGGVMGSRATAESAAIRDELDRSKSDMSRQADELGAAKLQLEEAASALRLVSSPGVKVFDLAAQGPGMKGAGRIFWDKRGGTWQVYCAEMPPLAPGRVYQLWFITPTAKLGAGTFRPSADGTALMNVKVPADIGLIVAATITEEPEGGSPKPTGAIRLLGQV